MPNVHKNFIKYFYYFEKANAKEILRELKNEKNLRSKIIAVDTHNIQERLKKLELQDPDTVKLIRKFVFEKKYGGNINNNTNMSWLITNSYIVGYIISNKLTANDVIDFLNKNPQCPYLSHEP